MRTRVSLVALFGAAALSGCGDDGPTGPGGDGSDPSGTPSFAGVRVLDPPGRTADDAVVGLWVTNAGVYMHYFNDARQRVMRLEAGGSTIDDWTSFQPAFGIASFAPVHLTLERREVFDGYWVQEVYSCNYPQGEKAGLWTVNSGTPSAEWTNDICAMDVIPSSSEDVNLRHTWMVAGQHGTIGDPKGGFYVEQAQKGGTNTLSADFEKVADLIPYYSLATSPVDNALWVGSDGKLVEIGESGTRRAYDLSAYGQGFAHSLRFQDETLWLSYAGQILRLRNGSITSIPGVHVASLPIRQFCVQGNTLFLTGGTKVDVTTGQKASYLADRDMAQMTRQEDIAKYAELLQKSVGMIDCATKGTYGVLYTTMGEQVYEILAK